MLGAEHKRRIKNPRTWSHGWSVHRVVVLEECSQSAKIHRTAGCERLSCTESIRADDRPRHPETDASAHGSSHKASSRYQEAEPVCIRSPLCSK